METYTSSHYLAQNIFADALPVIPLFTYQDIVLARPDICGFEFDPTAGFLWNIENLGYGSLCK
jgi:ABC-type transport system substrate-binding protein